MNEYYSVIVEVFTLIDTEEQNVSTVNLPMKATVRIKVHVRLHVDETVANFLNVCFP